MERKLLEVDGHSSPLYSLDYHPDGISLVTGSYGRSIRKWDAYAGGEPIMVLDNTNGGHNDYVYASHDGNHLVSCSRDNTFKLWDANSDTVICTVKENVDVSACHFRYDSSRIITTISEFVKI